MYQYKEIVLKMNIQNDDYNIVIKGAKIDKCFLHHWETRVVPSV